MLVRCPPTPGLPAFHFSHGHLQRASDWLMHYTITLPPSFQTTQATKPLQSFNCLLHSAVHTPPEVKASLPSSQRVKEVAPQIGLAEAPCSSQLPNQVLSCSMACTVTFCAAGSTNPAHRPQDRILWGGFISFSLKLCRFLILFEVLEVS